MTLGHEIGRLGEEIAAAYLARNGYAVISKNFRVTFGEIDIIAKAPNKTIVFVEVKALRQGTDLSPEDEANFSKLHKVRKTAAFYANSHNDLINEVAGWRIDLIAISVPIHALKLPIEEAVKISDIRHYENI